MTQGLQSSKLFSSRGQSTLVLALLLMAFTLALYSPATHNNFVNFDDDAYIIHNPHVRADLTWSTVKWAFTTFEEGNWGPLSWLSHALDCQWFGLNAAGHHWVSSLLHSINVVILFCLLESATGFTWRSFVVAALFAVHPVNVESVAWAAERKTVLSMFFFLLALLAYAWYGRQANLRRYLAVFFMFLLALMSKPQVITFPFLLLLWDYWPLERVALWSAPGLVPHDSGKPRTSWALLVREKIPLFILSAASAWLTVMAQRAGHALRTSSDYSFSNRIETALTSYLRYVALLMWPSKLAAFYPHPTELLPAGQVALATLALILATAVAAWQWRRRPYVVVGWLWFLGSLFPMIGLVQVGGHAMADRFAYIPFVGLFVIVVWTLADAVEQREIAAAWAIVPTVALLITLGAVTHRQIGFWRDSPTLWRRALDVTQNNFVAHTNLATFLEQNGQTGEAADHLRAALAIRPDDLPAALSLGTYEHQQGNLPAAIERYRQVALHAVDTNLRTTAYSNLGSAYRQLGDYTNAKVCYEAALNLSPGLPMAMVGLGLVAGHNGDFSEAVRQLSNAMAAQPTDVGYLLLARAYEQGGQPMESEAARQRASLISSDLDQAQRQANALIAGK
jgi:tetratricopeptide (TPR) repeat protein